MPHEREQGAREREPPRSAIAEAIVLNAVFNGSKQSRGLEQFSNKNIVNQRNNDIASKEQESHIERKSFKVDNARSLDVDNKITVGEERTAIIKQEFGSVENYNNFKNADKIADNRQSNIDSKRRLSSERSNLIKAEFGSFGEYKEAQNVISSEQRRNTFVSEKKSLQQQRKDVVKSGDTKKLRRIDNRISAVDSKIKAESVTIKLYFDKRSDSVDVLKARGEDKRSLYAKSERLTKVDENYSRLTREINRDTAKLKTVTHTEKPESLVKVDKKYNYFDSKINKHSDKLRQHSARLDKVLTERSDSKYFRASSGGHYRNSINSADRIERKAAKAEIKLDRASASRNLPQHYIVRKSYKFDPATGKVKKRLVLEKEVKSIDGGIVSKGLKGAGAITAAKLGASIHKEFGKNENDLQNVGAKAAHTAEKFAEHSITKGVQHAHKFLQERPYKKVSKLQHKSDKANAKLYAKKKGGNARQMKKNAQQYMNRAKQARQAQKNVGMVDKAAKAIMEAAKALVKKLACNPYFWLIVAIVAVIILIFGLVMTLVTSVGSKSGAILGAYLSADNEIIAAEQHAQTYEVTAIQATINGVIAANPHDILVINPYTLNRNPYALISFLSAYSFSESGDEYDNSFTVNNATKAVIERFINTYYYITYSVTSVTTTEEVINDDDEVEIIETTVTTLTITVHQRTADETAELIFNSGSPCTPEMYELYLIYMETLGYREDLFPAWA